MKSWMNIVAVCFLHSTKQRRSSSLRMTTTGLVSSTWATAVPHLMDDDCEPSFACIMLIVTGARRVKGVQHGKDRQNTVINILSWWNTCIGFTHFTCSKEISTLKQALVWCKKWNYHTKVADIHTGYKKYRILKLQPATLHTDVSNWRREVKVLAFLAWALQKWPNTTSDSLWWLYTEGL